MKKIYGVVIVMVILILAAGIYAINNEDNMNATSNQMNDNNPIETNNSLNSSNIHKTFIPTNIIQEVMALNDFIDESDIREISDDGVFMDEDERLKPVEKFDPGKEITPSNETIDGYVAISLKFTKYFKEIISHINDKDKNGNYIYPELHEKYSAKIGNDTSNLDYKAMGIVPMMGTTAFPIDQKNIYVHAHDLDENGNYLYPDLHEDYLLKFGDRDINTITPKEFTDSYKNEIYEQAHELDDDGNLKNPYLNFEYQVFCEYNEGYDTLTFEYVN